MSAFAISAFADFSSACTAFKFACGFFANQNVQEDRRQLGLVNQTRTRLVSFYRVIRNYYSSGLPQRLQELVDKNYLSAEDLRSPANPAGQGFFYHKPARLTSRAERKHQMMICDFRDNFGDEGRTVLFSNGDTQFLSPSAFRGVLHKEENREFAEALRKTEGQ